ncbi:lipoprotein [Streptomyces sp. NPDC004609]|uniref:lipoprotein n=1 Tax=Streptomyces sp. NPDC004609 TaxID=3364704 RepID=UPI0036D0E280
MARPVRRLMHRVTPAILLAALVTGCSSGQEPDRPATSLKGGENQETGGTTTPSAAGGSGTVGGKGSPCPLPVTFDLAPKWRPEAVKGGGETAMPSLGPVRLVCEIDAKPAGHVGFLRVWTGGAKGDDPRRALESFVAEYVDNSKDVVYTEARTGGFASAEADFLNATALTEEVTKVRALALATDQGLVVLEMSGMDDEEHEAMLPAFERAKKSVRATA